MPLLTLPGPEHRSWRGMVRYARETITVTEQAVSAELNLTQSQRKFIHFGLAIWLVVMIVFGRAYGLSILGTLVFNVVIFALAVSSSCAYLLLRRRVNEDWLGRLTLFVAATLAIIFDGIALVLPILVVLVISLWEIIGLILKLMR
ncbi:MAG: hypothetical protein QM537_09020 [Candidatus Symbiobacter sp.]|nr:hypothetical protein [Candidatus Symbiobacter sp.]